MYSTHYEKWLKLNYRKKGTRKIQKQQTCTRKKEGGGGLNIWKT